MLSFEKTSGYISFPLNVSLNQSGDWDLSDKYKPQ